MATTHAPSYLQSHTWNLPLDNSNSVKTEKIVQEDEPEYNKWFNVDSFPSLTSGSSSASLNSSSSSSTTTSNYTLQQAQQIANALNVVQSSAVYTPLTVNLQTSSTMASSNVSSLSVPSFNGTGFQGQFQPTIAFGYATNSPQPVQMSGNMSQQGPALNLIQLPLVNGSQQGIGSNQMVPQMIVLPGFGFQQSLSVNPQFYNLMLTQFQPLKNTQVPPPRPEETDDRKRGGRVARNAQRRVRQTRPKVVEAKGAVQCVGKNRKKGTQCRNAALMEYIGPRPAYCAEHIELDPESLYEKCKSSYQKEVGDKKGCKEVVLKEFGLCYKHYGDLVQEIVLARDIQKARLHSERISELLDQLEKEASAAKKKDGDLYQRKNKLIPKFQEMKKTIVKALDDLTLSGSFTMDFNAPVLNLTQDNIGDESIDEALRTHASAPQSLITPDLHTPRVLNHLS